MGGAPAVSPIPGSPVYAQEATLANNAYNNALAQINQNRLSTLSQYGYTGTVDPTTGVVSGVGVDPHSMYGALQQQMHADAVGDRGAEMATQDRGLVGGLAHQGAAELHYGHEAGLTNLGQSLQDSLYGLQGKQQQAAETRNAALWQAEQDALNTELQNEQGQTLDQLLNPGGDYTGPADNSVPNSQVSNPDYYKGPVSQTMRGVEDVLRGSRASSARERAQRKIINRSHRQGRQ